MSVIATAVRHMMAAGVTGDALLQAIAEMENAIRAEPKPRSSGAVRQQRYRENQLNKHTMIHLKDNIELEIEIEIESAQIE